MCYKELVEREPHPSDEQIFYSAVDRFPYELQPTSITQGTLETDEQGDIEYAEEFVFTAGQLLHEPLIAGGWIELRRDAERGLSVTAFFGLARNADWKNGRVLPEHEAIQGEYDITSQTWKLWLGSF